MIDPAVLDEEIEELKRGQPSYSTIRALADLYIVRDHIKDIGSSDFLQRIARYSPDEAWRLIDELMTEIQIEHPDLYNSFMDRL